MGNERLDVLKNASLAQNSVGVTVCAVVAKLA